MIDNKQFTTLIPNTEVFRAWVGAWVDTEGCIRIRKPSKRKNRVHGDRVGNMRYHRAVMEICQTDVEPLLMIQATYGGSLHHRKRQEHSRRIYELHIAGRPVQKILQDVLPYLIVKRNQAVFVLQFFDLVNAGLQGKKSRSRNNPITEQEFMERERLRKAVQTYNQGGRPIVEGELFN